MKPASSQASIVPWRRDDRAKVQQASWRSCNPGSTHFQPDNAKSWNSRYPGYLSSKEIGIKLNISPRTVENHRAWVMERIGARNLADLIRAAIKVGAHDERLD
jgi:regulatory LuxR family protein